MSDQGMTQPTHGVVRTVAAPPARVFRYLTQAQDQRLWLSDGGNVFDAIAGGHFLIRVAPDYLPAGIVAEFVPASRMVLSARDHRIELGLTPAGDDATRVAVSLSGDGATPTTKAHWEHALENLESVLTTGIDLRVARRPIMGVFYNLLAADQAQRRGLPVDYGFEITGFSRNSGALSAGLEVGDVLIEAENLALRGVPELRKAMQGKLAGDTLNVTVLRGADRVRAEVVLGAQRLPELPASREALVRVYREETDRLMWLVAESCDGLSEELANRRPAQDEWSVMQVLAHLIITERDNRHYVAGLFANSEPTGILANLAGDEYRLAAVVAAGDHLWGMLDLLRSEYRATLSLLRLLPAERLAEPAYFRVLATVFGYDFVHGHGENHLNQIRNTVASLTSQA